MSEKKKYKVAKPWRVDYYQKGGQPFIEEDMLTGYTFFATEEKAKAYVEEYNKDADELERHVFADGPYVDENASNEWEYRAVLNEVRIIEQERAGWKNVSDY